MNSQIYDKIEKYFSAFRLTKHQKGDYIIHSQNTPTGVFFLKSGFVKMNSIFEDGRELTLNIFKPGSFFPMMWVIGEKENNYYFQSLTVCHSYLAPKEDVLNFLKNNPDVLFDLTKRILSGLEGYLTNAQHLLYGNADHRVLSTLLICAKRFGTENKFNNITIDIPLTHQDIANLSGLTRETVSATIVKFEKNNLLSYHRNKLIILDQKKMDDSFRLSFEDIGDSSTV